MLNGLSVARIGVLLFPVFLIVRPPDPTPSLQPHYEPSSLLRIGPPQCSALGLSPCCCSPLELVPWHQSDWFLRFAPNACIDLRPLFAGRRLPSHQAHGRLVPGSTHVPGFDDDWH